MLEEVLDRADPFTCNFEKEPHENEEDRDSQLLCKLVNGVILAVLLRNVNHGGDGDNGEASKSGLVHNKEFASRANSKFIQTESVFWGNLHVSEASPSP